MLSVVQVSRQAEVDAVGRRLKKQQQLRVAIESAALQLFATKGYEATTVEEITELADVSKATFFRYFGSKGEVVFTTREDHFVALHRAVAARPVEESDLTAVMRAVQQEWCPDLDGQWVSWQRQAAERSSVLRGMSFDLGVRWQTVITEALAERRGSREPLQQTWLVAGLALTIFTNAVNFWVHDGRQGDLRTAIDGAYRSALAACSESESN
jgi:AcrR family transcriptional regulator